MLTKLVSAIIIFTIMLQLSYSQSESDCVTSFTAYKLYNLNFAGSDCSYKLTGVVDSSSTCSINYYLFSVQIKIKNNCNKQSSAIINFPLSTNVMLKLPMSNSAAYNNFAKARTVKLQNYFVINESSKNNLIIKSAGI